MRLSKVSKPSQEQWARSIEAHSFACLDGANPGPVQVMQLPDTQGTATGQLRFGWPIGGLEEPLQLEIEQISAELFGQPVRCKLDFRVAASPTLPLPGRKVHNLLAVASAKGGVGKSTLAVNLALALQRAGGRVGLLDADIQGPNLPMLLGLDPKTQPQTQGEGEQRQMIPLTVGGIEVLSMGMLAAAETAMIWRGPMVSNALRQLLLRTCWSELDYLVVDMPPGTGDIGLTLAQSVPLTAAVLVSTADAMALADTARGAAMFEKLKVPVLGLVENMSYWSCPGCGDEHRLFGGDVTDSIGQPLLASVPLVPTTAQGQAQLLCAADEPAADHWKKAARAIAIALARHNDRQLQQRPTILRQAT